MKNWNDKRGFSYFFTMSFAIILMLLSGGIQFGASVHSRIAKRQADMEQAFMNAESGIEIFLEKLNSDNFSGALSYVGATNIVTSDISVYVEEVCSNEKFDLVSTGSSGDSSRRITIKGASLASVSTFARANTVNHVIWDLPGEVFNGKVYWGDKPYIYTTGTGINQTPLFMEEAYTKSDTLQQQGPDNEHTFQKGIDFDTELDDPNKNVKWSLLKSNAQSYGIYINSSQDTFIRLNGSSMQIRNFKRYNDNNYHTEPLAGNSIIYTKGDVYFENNGSGNILNGELTVVSHKDIIIKEHVQYAQDPINFPNSDDVLGLIAKDDIWVHPDAPNNLKLHAALLASGAKDGEPNSSKESGGRFGVLEYWEGSPRGVINLLGSLVQDNRGAVGQFSWNTGASIHGFSKNYNQDPRFTSPDANGCRFAPPFYPTIRNRIEIEDWIEGPATAGLSYP